MEPIIVEWSNEGLHQLTALKLKHLYYELYRIRARLKKQELINAFLTHSMPKGKVLGYRKTILDKQVPYIFVQPKTSKQHDKSKEMPLKSPKNQNRDTIRLLRQYEFISGNSKSDLKSIKFVEELEPFPLNDTLALCTVLSDESLRIFGNFSTFVRDLLESNDFWFVIAEKYRHAVMPLSMDNVVYGSWARYLWMTRSRYYLSINNGLKKMKREAHTGRGLSYGHHRDIAVDIMSDDRMPNKQYYFIKREWNDKTMIFSLLDTDNTLNVVQSLLRNELIDRATMADAKDFLYQGMDDIKFADVPYEELGQIIQAD
jgi:hypothetical protein